MDDDLSLAIELAYEAGDIMRQGIGDSAVHVKADASPVTDSDLAIDALVRARLERARPGVALLSEESAGDADLDAPTWVMDPIDGTRTFTSHLGLSSFVLGLVVEGVTRVAVTYDPWTDRLYSAQLGAGAFVNGAPIHASTHVGLSRARIEVDVWGETPDLFSHLAPRSSVRCLRSSARAGAAVADGGVEGLCVAGVSAWDICASLLLVTEAGGRAEAIDGGEVDLREPIPATLLAAPGIFGPLAATWRACRDEARARGSRVA